MKEKALKKYNELKADRPNIDSEMVQTFIEEMPMEAIMLFDRINYGCHIVDETMYDKAVSLLTWADNKGKGAKWIVDDIAKICGIDFDSKEYYLLDYCYILNMLYSDNCNIFTEPSYYLKMAQNYLEDKDYMGEPSERAYKNAKKRIEYFEN